MVKFFRSWCEELILSSFIVSILEMITPEGNMKKYIRVVTGVYMIFAILSPILLSLNKINLEAEIERILDASVTENINTKEELYEGNIEQIQE